MHIPCPGEWKECSTVTARAATWWPKLPHTPGQPYGRLVTWWWSVACLPANLSQRQHLSAWPCLLVACNICSHLLPCLLCSSATNLLAWARLFAHLPGPTTTTRQPGVCLFACSSCVGNGTLWPGHVHMPAMSWTFKW